MDTVELQVGNGMLRMDDAIVELFVHGVIGSLRVPLTWFGVELLQQRRDGLRIHVGQVLDLQAPVITPNVAGGQWYVEATTADGSAVMGFLGELARRAGRTLEAS